MKKIVLVAITAIIFSCASTPESSSGFDGIWQGSGVQSDNNTTWTIKVSIAGNRHSYDYPSLNCGGNLTLLSQGADKIEFRETLTYGHSNCIDNGKTVILKVGANRAQYEWFYSSGKKGATGTLSRN